MVRWIPVVLCLALLVAVVVAPVWPGIFSIDSQSMYRSGPGDAISNQYSPLLEWFWGLWTDAGVGPWLASVVGVGLVVAGLFGVYTLQLRPWFAVAATAFTVLWPPVYGFLGWVGRDVWFAGLLLCALAVVGRLQGPMRRPWLLVLLAVGAAWLAAAARQNGFPVLVIAAPVAVYLGFALRWSRRRAALAAGLVGLVLAPAALVLAQGAATDIGRHPEQPLLYQDLLSVSLRLNEPQLSREVFPSQDLDQVRQTWTEGNVGRTIFPADAPVVFNPTETGGRTNDVLTDDWAAMVTDHPITYLGQRVRLQLKQLGLGLAPQYPYFLATDVSGGPGSTGLGQDWSGGNQARLDYLAFFGGGSPTGGALFTVWPYLLLGWLGAVLLAVRAPQLRLFALTALAMQVSLQLVLTFTAIAVEFRFEAFQVLLGIVMAVLCVASELERRRRT